MLFFGVLCSCLLDESPFFLALQGRVEETKRVLKRMGAKNGVPDVDVRYSPPPLRVDDPVAVKLKKVFGRHLISTTLIVAFSWFTANFTFYGCLYSFTLVLSDLDLGAENATSLILGALWEILGLGIGSLLSYVMERRPAIRLCLFTEVLALGALGIVPFLAPKTTMHLIVAQFGYFGIKVFCSTTFSVLIVYISEVFPTEVRTSGVGVAYAGGRLAAMFAPLIFELVGSSSIFFNIILLLCAMNGLLTYLLPFETFGQGLRDIDEDTESICKLSTNPC